MHSSITKVRTRFIAAAPWLPWAAPAGVAAVDTANVVDPALPLYLGLLAAAVTISTSALVIRGLGGRVERGAAQAQVDKAARYAYQMAAEHCERFHRAFAGELPHAVGETTVPMPGLHVVHPTGDEARAARGQVYRAKVKTISRNVPAQDGPATPRPVQQA